MVEARVWDAAWVSSLAAGVGPCAAVLRIAPNAPTAFPVLVSGKETP